jgi:hypothetical protein
MSSIGRRTGHGGQTTITLSGLQAHFDKAKVVRMRLSAQLQNWAKEAAEPLHVKSVWQLCCEYLKRILATIDPDPTTSIHSFYDHGFG